MANASINKTDNNKVGMEVEKFKSDIAVRRVSW